LLKERIVYLVRIERIELFLIDVRRSYLAPSQSGKKTLDLFSFSFPDSRLGTKTGRESKRRRILSN